MGMVVNPFAAEELQEDAERCKQEAQRLRSEAPDPDALIDLAIAAKQKAEYYAASAAAYRAQAAAARVVLLDAESYDLLADMSRTLAECDAMLQDKGL